MGSIRLGIDIDKVLALRDQYDLKYFIETGTWKGGSCTLAAQHFERVITIEADRGRFEKTSTAFAGQFSNLSFWFGDSRHLLAKALEEANQPCLCYLDAHWLGGAETAHRIGDECPLESELQAILSSPYADQHVIMIDDARLFLAPPPYPHDPAQWMTYSEIESMLAPRKLYVVDDVIYAEPLK